MDTPSPDSSGLLCPHCGYDLTGLTSNRCPECGGVFIIAAPPTSRGRSIRSFQIETTSMRCPACGTLNGGFMPRSCRYCTRPFSLWERIFGVGGIRIG